MATIISTHTFYIFFLLNVYKVLQIYFNLYIVLFFVFICFYLFANMWVIPSQITISDCCRKFMVQGLNINDVFCKVFVLQQTFHDINTLNMNI